MNENNENLKPVAGLKPFKKFCMSIGELPASYLETMTYYEMLVWFTKYLGDTVIPTINNNAECIEELQNKYIEFTDDITTQQENFETAITEQQDTYEEHITGLFNELHDYVQNYFDNLDVQEEIDNKLDDMVEQGTLQAIISEYLNSIAIFGFDNVSSMTSSTNLIDGSYARTMGYYTKNDGGSGLYKIRTKTNDDVVDDGSIIAMSDNTLIAELVTINNEVNVKQFGAKGDGTTNDSVIIQTAITYCSNTNKTLKIDKSTYLVNNSLVISGNNMNIICDGTLKTSNGTTIINISGSYHNIYINKLLSASRSGVGLFSHGVLNFCNITINNIDDFDIGISLDTSSDSTSGIYYNYFKNSQITANTCLNLNANNRYINQNYFYMGALNGSTGVYSEEITESTGEYNGNCFFNCGFENLVTPIELNNMTHNTFKDFRIYESISGSKFIKLNNCDRNLFQSNSVSALLQNTNIQDNTPTRKLANIFECYITLNGSATSEFSRKCLSYNGLFEIVENGTLPAKYSFGNDTIHTNNLTPLSIFSEFKVYNSSADTKLYLDERYSYNNEYTQNLILYVSFIGGNNDLLVYDSNNNLVLDLLTDYLSQGLVTAGGSAIFRFTLCENKLYPTLIYKSS